jgi:hypothetical protein
MGDTLIESGRADPAQGDFRWERHEVDVDTGTGGGGSTTLNYDEEFADGSTVTAHVTATDTGDYFASAAGGTQATIEASGAPASSTLTCNVLVIGAEK